MKTRRVRNEKKKGGKTAKENHDNYVRVWRNDTNYRYYDPKMNYPSWRGYSPSMRQEKIPQNTYIFKRHGFSCANMLKEKGSFEQYSVPDPSLCSYGIFSLLRNKPKPDQFDGFVFVSSLVRTWQTAILEYGSYGPLTLIVSPYIKEKDSHPLDAPNFPLPFPQQIASMRQFMQLLRKIDSPVAKQILSHQHKIIKEDLVETFGRYDQIIERQPYLETIKLDASGKTSTEKEVEKYIFIPAVSEIPKPDFTKYYKAEGFLYFDYWVQQHFPTIKTVFVVSHSGFMKKIIQQFSEVPVDSGIFKQNVWTLRISPKEGFVNSKMNYKINIYPGIPKPTSEELTHMNRRAEPLCNAISVQSEPSTHSDLNLSYHSSHSSNPDSSYHSIDSRDSSVSNSVHSDTSTHSLSSTPSSTDFVPTRSESMESTRLSILTEETSPRIKATPVTTEKTEWVLTRSFTELIHMLCNSELANKLSELIRDETDFKTKVMQFVYSNPVVQIQDPSQPKSYFKARKKVPIYLFENHYLAFLLMDTSYFNSVVKKLESSNARIVNTGLSYFGIRASSASVIAFLKQLRILINEDREMYQLLLDKFSVGANRHYYLKAVPYFFSFTLLDLLLYEFNPTLENIQLMYRFIIDLVKNDARFSETVYSREDAVSDWIEFPSSDIIPLTMPSVQLETVGTEQKERELEIIWNDTKRRLDPGNELSQLTQSYSQVKRKLDDAYEKLQPLYISAKYKEDELLRIHEDFMEKNKYLIDQLKDIKRKFSEAKSRIDPNNEFLELRLAMRKTINTGIYTYVNMHLADLIDSKEVQEAHNDILKRLLELPKRSEPGLLIGGSRGTSWKRSLLRQSSVKAGRYRALRYKGKRRTRANRL